MSDPIDREVAVFGAARLLPAAERAAYLNATCAGNALLRQRVEELLGASEEAGEFLQDPAQGAQRPTLAVAFPNPLPNATAPGEKVGDRIGRYKLLQQIGEGGCGVVYMAEQEEPVRRRVALKVIKLGMDTKQVIARFEAERQALALMDHPNIAKVLEAGATDTGRPYFVMELVRGIKITHYCDENNLSTEDRLDLFIQVAQAVQHAHQKGIIHRDLKPSNILVADHDGVPVPKIIDFGIAKATTDQRLTDKTLFTAFEQFIGTPAYMSPEQARMSGLDIDTRTDIYSLGVLLYELLTGKTPFDAQDLLAAGLDEMRRTINEQEPARPSTRLSTMLEGELTTTAKHRRTDAPKLIHRLRGDLDWIVMKALEKDRTRRYETANGLAMEIQRHLKNEPVAARPPSSLYRFRKLVRRNKLTFSAAAAISATLVLGVIVSTWQAIRATQEAAKATAINNFLQQMLSSANPDALKGSEYTVRQLLDDFSAGLANQLKDQPEVEATVRATIGRAYYRLGVADKALAHHERALTLRRRIFGDQAEPVAESLVDYTWACFEQGDHAKGEPRVREALEIYLKHGTTGQPVISAYFALQRILIAGDRVPEIEAVTEEATITVRKSPGVEFPELASMIHGLAEVRIAQSRYAEAEALAQEAVAMHRRLRREGDLETAWALVALGSALNGERKLDAAEQALREALKIFRGQYAPGHKSVDLTLFRLKAVLEAKGDSAAIEALYREILAGQRAKLGNDNPAVAETLSSLATSLQSQGKQTAAEETLREALDIILKLRGQDLERLPPVMRRLAEVQTSQGKSRDAEKLYEETIPVVRLALGESDPALGEMLHDFGEFLNAAGKWEAAAEQYIKSLPIRHAKQDDNLAWTLRNLGGVLLQARRPADAEPHLRESLAVYRKLHQREDINGTVGPAENLSAALYQQQKLPEAERAYRDALAACAKCQAVGGDEYARVVRSLLDVLKAENKLAEGEALCREILVQQRAAFANDNPAVAQTMSMLADSLASQGKQAEAEKLLREALRVFRQATTQNPKQRAAVAVGSLELAQRAYGAAQYETSERASRQAISLFQQLIQDYPREIEYPKHLGHSQWHLAQTLMQTGRSDQAEPVVREAVKVFETAARDFPAEPYFRQEQAFSHRTLGDLFAALGQIDQTELHYRTAIRFYTALLTETPANTFYNGEEAYTTWGLATLLERAGRLDAAAAEYRQASALYEKVIARFPSNADFKPQWDSVRNRLVSLLNSQGKWAEAEILLRDELVLARTPDTNAPSQVRPRLGWILHHLADVLRERKALQEARALADEASTLYERHPDWPAEERQHAFRVLEAVLTDLGDFIGLEALLRDELRDVAERGNAQDMNELAWRLATSADAKLRDGSNAVTYAEKASTTTGRTNAMYLDTLAAAYAEASQFDQAVSVQKEAMALLRNQEEREDLASRLRLYESKIPYRDDGLLASRATDLLAAGKFAEAESPARECLALREMEIPDDWRTFNARSMLGGALLGQKKYAQAEPLLLSGYDGMMRRVDKISLEGKPRLKETLQRLVQLYQETNRPDQVAEWNRKLTEFDSPKK